MVSLSAKTFCRTTRLIKNWRLQARRHEVQPQHANRLSPPLSACSANLGKQTIALKRVACRCQTVLIYPLLESGCRIRSSGNDALTREDDAPLSSIPHHNDDPLTRPPPRSHDSRVRPHHSGGPTPQSCVG